MIRQIGTASGMFRPSQKNCLKFFFSKDKIAKSKVQTVGFASENIENIKNLNYKVKQPLLYKEGKLLIYQARFSLLRSLKDYFLHIIAFATLSYLVYYKVNFTVYPIIKHLYVAGIAITLAFVAHKFLKNQNIVRQIYLLEGGKASQVHYMNQFKRKVFGQKLYHTYYNSLFYQPKQKTSSYPKSLPRVEKQFERKGRIFSYWHKYYSNSGNLLLIPTGYEQMNCQLLTQVMNGKTISS